MRRLWIGGLVAVMLIGCAAQSPETDEPILATPMAEATKPPITVTAVPARTHPAEISTLTATSTDLPSLAVTPSGTHVDPLLSLVEELAFGMSEKLMGWSPSGAWVWYVGLHNTYFYQPETGKDCWLDRWENDGTVMNYYWSWLVSDRLLVRDQNTDTLVVISDPCVELNEGARVQGFNAPYVRIESASPDYQRVILSTPEQVYIYYADSGGLLPIQLEVNAESLLDAIWSPQGSRLALIKYQPHGETDTHTWIIDPSTGGLIDEIQWGYFGGDPPRWPTWITENRMLFYMTKQGPLMLTVGEETINVASDLFGYDCSVTVCQVMTVEGARSPDGFYHLLLRDTNDPQNEITMLYHGESGEVEVIESWKQGIISPDGELLLLTLLESGALPASVGVRRLDPVGSEIHAFTESTGFSRWHPNSTMIYTFTESSIAAFNARDGALLGEWWADGGALGNARPLSWSPDGRLLAVVGSDGQIYLIPIP